MPEHENVTVAKLDAAKFIVNHFDTKAICDKKPVVYDAAIAYIAKAIQEHSAKS